MDLTLGGGVELGLDELKPQLKKQKKSLDSTLRKRT